jgi:hypothetical protein
MIHDGSVQAARRGVLALAAAALLFGGSMTIAPSEAKAANGCYHAYYNAYGFNLGRATRYDLMVYYCVSPSRVIKQVRVTQWNYTGLASNFYGVYWYNSAASIASRCIWSGGSGCYWRNPQFYAGSPVVPANGSYTWNWSGSQALSPAFDINTYMAVKSRVVNTWDFVYFKPFI